MRALVINQRLRHLPQTGPRRPRPKVDPELPFPHTSTAPPRRATPVVGSATCVHWTLVTVDRALMPRSWSGRPLRQMIWDASSAFDFFYITHLVKLIFLDVRKVRSDRMPDIAAEMILLGLH
jgi:hypothetical protein